MISQDVGIGTDIHVNGVPYLGLISLGEQWWLAVRKDDQDNHVSLVKEDIE